MFIFAHFYLNSLPSETAKIPSKASAATYLVLAETKLSQLQTPEKINPSDLKEVVEILDRAADSISSMPKNPAATAEVVEGVAGIKKQVQKLAENKQTAGVEEIKAKTSVLASKVSEKLKENIQDTTAEYVKSLIKMLKTRSLTDEQQELFKKAEADYNNGNYEQALEEILKLTNNNRESQ